MLPLFIVTMFVSALLLFLVQPMFTKAVLPLLGGSPGVWNTAMMFFQTMLLAGYTYAHLATKFLSARWQVGLHAVVIAAGLLALPIGVAAGWTPPVREAPVFWLLGLFAVSVGLPFFALSANAPLLQRWFAHTDHPAAADPYFLYAASNLGSLLALLAFPVVMEPLLRAHDQSLVWAAGYVVLLALVAACAVPFMRHYVAPGRSAAVPRGETITGRRRLHWLVLAFVPSSLLLGVTTHITTDIASAPMLWVLPLALYLLTFVIVFARRPALPHGLMVRAQPFFLILMAIVFWWVVRPFAAVVGLHLAVFFVTAMVCHGELVKRRPEAGDLTEFYLWMSLGGMLGGVFNVLIAPLLFDSVIEYPLALVLACMLRPVLDGPDAKWRRLDVILPTALLAMVTVPALGFDLVLADLGLYGLTISFVVLGLATYSFRLRPVRFGLGIGVILIGTSIWSEPGNVLAEERSFFGVHRVTQTRSGEFNMLIHGNTIHGAQHTDPELWREPLTYFHKGGPLGHLFSALGKREPLSQVGVIGLGTGSVACYRRPGETWTFLEIDPLVEQIARDQRYFHFLSECAPELDVVLGDGRLTLAGMPDRRFSLLIVDAFSSDSIPVHLLTREAIALYMSKLADGGLVAFNVSNRVVDLAPVLATLAHDLGIAGRHKDFRPTDPDRRRTFRLGSEWVILARREKDLSLLESAYWDALPVKPGARPWTDDFSNLLGAFRW